MATSEASSTAASPALHATTNLHGSVSAYLLPNPSERSLSTSSSISQDMYDSVAQPHPRYPSAIQYGELYNADQNVKSNLTDLLNYEVVRNNPEMRLWVQGRLMEAERELKRQRRKKTGLTTPVDNTNNGERKQRMRGGDDKTRQ